jgi:hypothetical protein
MGKMHRSLRSIGLLCCLWLLTILLEILLEEMFYEQIIVEIIKKTEGLGLKVVSLTSDMGSSSQGLWKVWNIGAGRHSEIHNFTAHP